MMVVKEQLSHVSNDISNALISPALEIVYEGDTVFTWDTVFKITLTFFMCAV